jgi:hypothetical protein
MGQDAHRTVPPSVDVLVISVRLLLPSQPAKCAPFLIEYGASTLVYNGVRSVCDLWWPSDPSKYRC